MDLKVGGREGEPAGSHIRAVLETRSFLLSMRRETEPPKLRTEGVPEPVVAPSPGPRIPKVRVRVVTFRIIT